MANKSPDPVIPKTDAMKFSEISSPVKEPCSPVNELFCPVNIPYGPTEKAWREWFLVEEACSLVDIFTIGDAPRNRIERLFSPVKEPNSPVKEPYSLLNCIPVKGKGCSYTKYRSVLFNESPVKDFESADPLPEKSSYIESKSNLIVGRAWPVLIDSDNEDSYSVKISKWIDTELDNKDWDINYNLTTEISNLEEVSRAFQELDSKLDVRYSNLNGESSALKPVESPRRGEEFSDSDCSDISSSDCSDASSSESLHSESFESSSSGSESLHSESFESSSDGSETLHSESFESSESDSDSELLNQKLAESQPQKSEEPHSTTSQHSCSDSEELVSESSESPSEEDPIFLDATYTEGPYSDNYTHLKRLCKGTFGCVAKGYRNSDGLLVFTKFIRKSAIYNDVMVYNCKLLKNVPIEMSLLQCINHPNIVKVLDVFENDHYFHLVMEKHGCGMDLFTFINRNTCREEPLICYIFRQIVDALSYLHSINVAHRDVKDENCLIDQNFHVKLIDFGSAGIMKSKEPFTTFYGTKEYCSPEVIRGEKYYGPELEVFALGVTLYTLAFGDIPFKDKKAILKGEYTFPKYAPKALVDLIDGMLEPVVEHRFILPEVEINKWVNQEVDIRRYSFADAVVDATEKELHPCKYVSLEDLEDIPMEDGGLRYMKSFRDVAFKFSFCC